MPQVHAWTILIGVILITTLVVTSHYSRAQLNPSLPAGFGQALAAVNNAEAAGATSTETAPLVALLNEALELDQEASRLPANQTGQRDSLLSSVNKILMNVTNQANDLSTTAAQRAYTNKIIVYVTGLFLAIIGTVAYIFGMELYQRYRIRRTFQMRVTAK